MFLVAAKGKCAIALASASVQGEGARQGPHLVGWQGACVLLLMCSCKCGSAIASVLLLVCLGPLWPNFPEEGSPSPLSLSRPHNVHRQLSIWQRVVVHALNSEERE